MNKPVFVAMNHKGLYTAFNINFDYSNQFSKATIKNNIQNLHEAFLALIPENRILEVSTNSPTTLGRQLSAFNLMINTKNGKKFSVESAYQSSKVFEHGGPYSDLLSKSSYEAKTDSRIKSSGKLIDFIFAGKSYPTEPLDVFYNWLYINALNTNNELADKIMEYDSFTDIFYNPNKIISCQAKSCAIYVSLRRQNLLDKALNSVEDFIKIVYPTYSNDNK